MREHPLLCPAFFLVSTGAAKSDVELPLVQRLTESLRLHHLGVDCRSMADRGNASPETFLIDMHQKVHAKPRRRFIPERNHLTKFPGRVDMQQRKRRLSRSKSFFREMQHRARVLSDRVKHHRVAKFGDGFSQDMDRFRLEPSQTEVLPTPVYFIGWDLHDSDRFAPIFPDQQCPFRPRHETRRSKRYGTFCRPPAFRLAAKKRARLFAAV